MFKPHKEQLRSGPTDVDASPWRILSKAPAKLILTGEHATLYGCPAIATSVNRFAATAISAQPLSLLGQRRLSIFLEDLRSHVSGTLSMFHRVRSRLLSSYKQFITGRRSIRDVLTRPGELFQFAIATLIDACYLELEEGLDIHISSSIPIGCGMGSSAATIVSFIRALMSHFGINKGHDWIERIVMEIEGLQHGRSSGIDTYISLHGGAIAYEAGKKPSQLSEASKKTLDRMALWIINTGKPESTTGECVQFVRSSAYGTDSHPIWSDFQSITKDIQSYLEQENTSAIRALIRENHSCLHRLGIVPEKVHSFIQKAQQSGVSMKITGAGAIRGTKGGIILGVGPKPPQKLLDEYGYPLCEDISIVASGSEVARGSQKY